MCLCPPTASSGTGRGIDISSMFDLVYIILIVLSEYVYHGIFDRSITKSDFHAWSS